MNKKINNLEANIIDTHNSSRHGYEIIVDTLKKNGIDTIYSHTGGVIAPIHVEINKRLSRKEQTPKSLMFVHEPGAGHAAEGYSRVTGKPSVVLATSGPGATNCITPMLDAYKDSSPVIFITGQVPSHLIGSDAFQESPTTIISENINKHSFLVTDIDYLEDTINQAFKIATKGRPGPVLIDICADTVNNKTKTNKKVFSKDYNPNTWSYNKRAAKKIINGILNSKKPLITVGGGVISSGASYDLRSFMDKYNIPVITTFMGLGSVRSDHEYNLGMPGMHGTYAASRALKECDFLLTIGGRFDDRVANTHDLKDKMIAHVDIDASEINKVIKAILPLKSDAKKFLNYCNSLDLNCNDNHEKWLKEIKSWKKISTSYEESDEIIQPEYLVDIISKLTNGDATIVTDVGQHQMWVAQRYNFTRPRQWISSGGLGTMGFGLPASIGAYLGNPEKQVIQISGDGGFKMNMQELETIAKLKAPIKNIIFNNSYLGMVRQWQDILLDGYHHETCQNRIKSCEPSCNRTDYECRDKVIDFRAISSLYKGIETIRLKDPKTLENDLKEILMDPNPYVVDVWINKTANVLPMIPAGKGFDDIIYKK